MNVRPVEDIHKEPEVIVRLTTGDEDALKKNEQPVLLGPAAEHKGPVSRVKLQLREDIKTRSIEPDIETIIEAPTPSPELLEKAWGDEVQNAKPVAWGWFVILAVTMAAATVWSLYKVEKSEKQNLHIEGEAKSIVSQKEENEREAARLIDRMEALLRSFYNATSIEAMLPLVRHPERVRPLMENHYGKNPLPLVRLRSIHSLNALTVGSSAKFWTASVNQSEGVVKNILIEVDDTGNPLIDWEAYVCYQPLSWDDYIKHRPSGASLDFRVSAKPDNFFSHEFKSASQWICLQLNAPGSEEYLYGYAKTDSEVAAQIAALIAKNGGGETSMILRLRFPENIQSKRGVIVEKLVAKQWFFIEPPAADP